MALQSGIVRLLAESANTVNDPNHLAGYRSEAAVVRLLNKRGWKLECHRARTTIAEIDLIFSKNNEIVLVEVKKLDNGWRAFERIGKKQYQALQRNLVFLSTNLKSYRFIATVCWVDIENKISFVLVN